MISEGFWSEWGDSNARSLEPKSSAIPTSLHPDIHFPAMIPRRGVKIKFFLSVVIYVVKAAFVPLSAIGENPANAGVARLCGVSQCPVPDTATALPKQARYQLRYTPIVIKLWSCKWSNLWSNTFLTAFFHFPNRPKSARLKGFRRFSLSCGANTVYAPKQARYQLRYTPIYLIFYFVNPVNFDITVRCASLKNIVALLAWSASHCSLFFHLKASPESSAGRGEPLRPTALHPDIFDFLLCYSCETQHNNPLFARKCIEFQLNA